MKKMIMHSFYGENNPNNRDSLFGCSEEIIWRSTKYYGGPKDHDDFIVSDGNGNVSKMRCTGRNETGMVLFQQYINYHTEIVWGDNFEELTSDELIKLCTKYNVWYCYEDIDGGYDPMDSIVIYRNDGIPKYYLDILKGPIDSEIDGYETEYYDLKKDENGSYKETKIK